MKRRKFLTIAGITGAIAAVASTKLLVGSFERSAEKLIKDELSFLRLDPAGLTNFVSAYAQTKDRNYKLVVQGYSLLGINASQSGKIHQLVSDYLLSTDFFAHKQDESRVIKFVALYNPHKRACTHPFSHLQYPDDRLEDRKFTKG